MKRRIKIINEIKDKTGNSPDIIYKDFPINNEIITLIYSNSVSSSTYINDFILRRLDEDKNNIKDQDLFNYIKNYIPNNSMAEISSIKDILYYLFSGFTIIIFNDKNHLAFENKSKIFSDVQRSENEKSLKGPSDSFTENYEINTVKIDIRTLTPEMRERILRNLFEKINKGYEEAKFRELNNIMAADISDDEGGYYQ